MKNRIYFNSILMGALLMASTASASRMFYCEPEVENKYVSQFKLTWKDVAGAKDYMWIVTRYLSKDSKVEKEITAFSNKDLLWDLYEGKAVSKKIHIPGTEASKGHDLSLTFGEGNQSDLKKRSGVITIDNLNTKKLDLEVRVNCVEPEQLTCEVIGEGRIHKIDAVAIPNFKATGKSDAFKVDVDLINLKDKVEASFTSLASASDLKSADSGVPISFFTEKRSDSTSPYHWLGLEMNTSKSKGKSVSNVKFGVVKYKLHGKEKELKLGCLPPTE